MCRCRCQVGLCALGIAIVVNAGALQWRPPLEVGTPLEVQSPLEVALLCLGREEETLEGYFTAVVVRVGRVPVGWWEEIGG